MFSGHNWIMAQATGDPKEDFLYGEYYVSGEQFEKAIPFYLSALKQNPDNSNINYRIGQCYLMSLGIQNSAVPYLEKAVENIDMHYIDGRYKDRRAPVEAWLLLGDAYHRDNQMEKASHAYHEYKRLISDSDKEKQELIMKRIDGLGIASEFQRDEEKLKLFNLGGIINTRFSDYNPVFSGDERTMAYTQFWESYDRVLISNFENGEWSKPKDITGEIASEGDSYTSALSFDGEELYLVRHVSENYDIYVSEFNNGLWGKMELLEGKVNSRHRESSVSISADGAFLYFASDRPGGNGGFDIYRATKTGDSWTKVQNLGKPVNTRKNEEAPYISYDGTILYFSSDGHMTIGNMDIVYSKLDEENKWTLPVNIGSPINTTNDDIFYVYFKDTQQGYLSRDMADGFGKNDIYMVQRGNLLTHGNKTGSDKNELTDHTTFPEKASTLTPSGNDQALSHNAIAMPYDEVNQYEMADSIPTYTIQIYAVKKPIKKVKIKLSPLIISLGEDGLYRYTYGEFAGWSKALELLDEIRNSGYPDAFIRNISTVQNYQGNQ
jgi:hypothetical protein